MSIASMKVSTRLSLAFGAVVAMLLVVSALSIFNLRMARDELDDVVNDKFPKTVWANDIIDQLNMVARAMRNTLILDDVALQTAELKRLDEAKVVISKNLDLLTAKIQSPEGKAILTKLLEARTHYLVDQERFVKLVNNGVIVEAKDHMLNAVRKSQQAYIDAVTKVIEFQTELMNRDGKEAISSANTAVTLVLALSGAALLLAAVVAVLITRGLTAQLGGEPGYAAEAVKRIAAGDLTQPIVLKQGDSTSLLASMAAMQTQLSSVVTQIKQAVDTVATGASEIAAGNTDLSQRTEEQASSLEETASSMEELTSTVKQNADNAKQANQLAISASDVAVKGGMVVGNVVDTMESIAKSSKKIADIISVIDGIAFQTNILALNAAVEAARAGEQGRGFAVVASEVRNLAQRSAAAAKEIKDLIGDSSTKVDSGSKLVAEAGATMDEVVQSVKRVTDIMAEISAASMEQSSGIEQVNQAIVQMDQVTQQNAALVEESAAAAESMQQQAGVLAETVAVFRVNGVAVHTPVSTHQVSSTPAARLKAHAGSGMETKARLAPKRSVQLAGANRGADEWKEF